VREALTASTEHDPAHLIASTIDDDDAGLRRLHFPPSVLAGDSGYFYQVPRLTTRSIGPRSGVATIMHALFASMTLYLSS
jgi:hypothetical protein